MLHSDTVEPLEPDNDAGNWLINNIFFKYCWLLRGG